MLQGEPSYSPTRFTNFNIQKPSAERTKVFKLCCFLRAFHIYQFQSEEFVSTALAPMGNCTFVIKSQFLINDIDPFHQACQRVLLHMHALRSTPCCPNIRGTRSKYAERFLLPASSLGQHQDAPRCPFRVHIPSKNRRKFPYDSSALS